MADKQDVIFAVEMTILISFIFILLTFAITRSTTADRICSSFHEEDSCEYYDCMGYDGNYIKCLQMEMYESIKECGCNDGKALQNMP